MMKRAMLMVILLVLTINVAGASNQYDMVLSKDDKLCSSVLSSLNKDLAEYGEIRYGTHRATPVIRWHRMKELGSPLEDTECEQFQWAKFDFNNDGKQDLVVKYSSCRHDVLQDELLFFDADYTGLKSVHSRQEFFQVLRETVKGYLAERIYRLPELAKTTLDPKGIGFLVINPFLYGGVTYLHIDPMGPSLDGVYMHVVAKYTKKDLTALERKQRAVPVPPGQNPPGVGDVCYFRMQIQEYEGTERMDGGLTLRERSR